jgi:signal transduction histidine kinase/CheY-like chemotaxis protein
MSRCVDKPAANPEPCTNNHVGLEDVVTTHLLVERHSRQPDHGAENRGLIALAQTMATSPRSLLQQLVNLALTLTGAGSAGISVFEKVSGSGVFRWRATAGAFSRFEGSTMPRDFSPCGVVLDRNAPQLMVEPVRYWPYIADLCPHVTEVLLVPFYNGDIPIGTVWIVAHPGGKLFDSEDARLIESLSRFASAGTQIIGNLDSLEAANRSKDKFMAILSHELRTPLTPALMVVTAMENDETLPATARDDARVIRRNIEFETRLIDDLLDVTRLNSGKVELRMQTVDLHDTLRHCVDMCRDIAAQRQVTVDLKLSADLYDANGDPARLRQVFSNLLGNAVKFTPNGGNVTISTSNMDGGIQIMVRDTGIGIESELLPHVFDSFEQGGRTTTSQFGGLGLGLTIARGFVEMHGGHITAESEGHGLGTTLTVFLPSVTKGRPAQTPPSVNHDLDTALNILLVEDHEDSLNMISRMLRSLRHRVETATNMAEALSIAEHFNFNMLISDIGLPDGSGLDLIRTLLLKRPIHGIALTGYGSATNIAETIEAGFEMHLTKPVRFDELKDAVRRVGSVERAGTDWIANA